MDDYTVVGVRDESGALTVAGVFRGILAPVDTQDGDDDAQRWCDSFSATDADDAEQQAHDQCAEDSDGG